MRRFVMLFAIVAACSALGAVACGDGNKPPPLTPDVEHPVLSEDGDAGVLEAPPID